ncbi:hypothetical protein Q4517_11495 [Tenacibaculum sp. 1_MG-2023]|uniref:DUF7738 domain-containing protein n=1 Tax=Tenacibaculum sp. 1_MG-2023 TaxID=3062653 RepID=UPI0026E14B84|nr:hypothetical protein [Tenacibaculum sp. 1_MG-2023]MDO6676169.1 hypothetical protein [Tenacibaculum sp. 1_MG-2023]
MKKIFILFCAIMCTQCNGQNKEANSIKNQLKHFNNQQHRLEFKEEKLFYNNQHVKLDQNMAYYEAIFGKDYDTKRYGTIIRYKNLPISMNKGADDIIDNIHIELYYYNQEMLNHKSDNETWGFPPKILDNDYMLIDGVPLNKDTDIEVFNRILAKAKKRTFTQKFEGVPAVEREYLSIESPLENIHISFGELSNLDFIMYSDGSTSSN